MRNIKITYQYDGSDFYGLQKLKNRRTVQGEFEKFLKIIFKEEIKLISAGRTDRGVHALFQVSNFVTKNMSLDIKKLKYILNRGLPNDINILNIEEVELDFHSRFCVQDRAYIYKMSHIKNPFKHKKIKIVREKIDVNKLQEILNPLIGEHDFDSFRKTESEINHSIREIKEIRCYEENEEIIVYIKANAFLQSMVRVIIGSALAVYFGQREKDYIIKKLKNPNVNCEKILAEPEGLYLYEINYY